MPVFNDVDLDFKLLLVFQALMKTRKVSEAGEQLGISQPTMSRSLARLREHFSDPLFVRTQRSMEPTPCALEVAPYVEEMLNLYYTQLSQKQIFEPKLSKRTFHIAASEVGHMLILPKLVNLLATEAPMVKIKAVPLGMRSLIELLETGQADVAFGAYTQLYAGVYERTLSKAKYVCITRQNHPTIKNTITLDEYRQANHVIVTGHGYGHLQEQIEKQLYGICPPENIRVVTHNFLSTVLLVEQTDLVATLPSVLLDIVKERTNVQVLELPFELAPIDVKIYWHERFHLEASNQWLRTTIGTLFEGLQET